MVSRSLWLAVSLLGGLGLGIAGCGDPLDKNAQKSAPLSIEDQIKNIENAPGMPDDVKAKTIEGLRQQQATQAAAKSNGS